MPRTFSTAMAFLPMAAKLLVELWIPVLASPVPPLWPAAVLHYLLVLQTNLIPITMRPTDVKQDVQQSAMPLVLNVTLLLPVDVLQSRVSQIGLIRTGLPLMGAKRVVLQ